MKILKFNEDIIELDFERDVEYRNKINIERKSISLELQVMLDDTFVELVDKGA
jgi:hypothetical protein